MKIVFAGTPAFAASSLDALLDAGHEIALVMAQPDRPAGRGLQVHPGPVKQRAVDAGIAVLQPRGLRVDGRFAEDARVAHETLAATPHDAMVVAAYGLILPPSILAIPALGCLNVHASLLPRWRGAAPIQRAIEAGDRETGITIMQMDAGLDTGDVLLARSVPIDTADTGASLTAKLAALGGTTLVDALARLRQGTLAARPQHAPGDASDVTYAAKLSKSETPLDFSEATHVLIDRIRAFDPWPGRSAVQCDDAGPAMECKVWAARPLAFRPDTAPGTVLQSADADGLAVATGDGAILLTEMQRPGGKRMAARFFKTLGDGRAVTRFAPVVA